MSAHTSHDHKNREVMLGDNDLEFGNVSITFLNRVWLWVFGLIRPEARTKWDVFILVLLAWVLFASPVIICFGLTELDVRQPLDGWIPAPDPEVAFWLSFAELLVDIFFLVDIYLNFRTAYYDSKGRLVSERGRIARHYARTWFLLDFICVVPYDLLTQGTMSFLSMLKILRVAEAVPFVASDSTATCPGEARNAHRQESDASGGVRTDDWT
eukprot:CAMPEP_0175083354 /NCGR_PEP_ID=MMETSP0052_2-20121109/27331_1 /TAXON_ID=51329 ORGANISM="Polytomella parva, Strain SAG 63-3" /NCGR_SAMPLE_ID=MMETSP0052_2 /ASSEMBLY_ACC=CAM_ASM_000194 /LENGTH=211 /DNA_ID=CAMNT_0016354785 /DNA_START=1 /DNA_END=632 /DNA_ORIENTATION=+